MCTTIKAGPMLNAYPDSLGGTLKDIIQFLKLPELTQVFQSFYILPSIFHTDLDRGFSVIDYDLNELFAEREDLVTLKEIGIDLKLDFVLNHASVLSKQFKDILINGEDSIYKDFFIDWNKFWAGHGQMTKEGHIKPDYEMIKDMFFRKPGLPILNVRMPNGKEIPYWNTFYQKVSYPRLHAQDIMNLTGMQYVKADRLAEKINAALSHEIRPQNIEWGKDDSHKEEVIEFLESKRKYLGQMDLNIKSPLVWEFYEETLKKLAGYGAQIVRLDAFAYAPKEPGEKNFLNDPGTWDLLERVRQLANHHGLSLLPEIHARYEEKIHEKIAGKGYMTYDFFLPGLILDAFERHSNEYLITWIKEILTKNIRTVNMLGCHDGIPLLDLKGLLTKEQIQNLIHTVVERGGCVKDLHGQKNVYYQVNSTYYSALGEDDRKLLLARAIQLFMPGKPQVWYLDLFAGKNDYEAVKRTGPGGHKEINRTNLSRQNIRESLKKKVVRQQLALLRFRNTFPAFGFDSRLSILETEPHKLCLHWENQGHQAELEADLKTYDFMIRAIDQEGKSRSIL